MRPSRLVVLPTLAILLAACDGSTQGPPSPTAGVVPACCAAPRDATVTGALVGIGGPAGADVQHWAGTIHARGTGFTTVRTDDRGHFTATLAPGTYRFTATSPSYDGGKVECRARGPVRLRAHHITHLRVVCQLK